MKPKRNKKQAAKYQGQPCVICGSRHGTVGDHIKTFGSGGKCEDENMWALCFHHHHEKGSMPLVDFVKKYPQARKELVDRGWNFSGFQNKWTRSKAGRPTIKYTKRQCLKCDKLFNSRNAFNKLCPNCQNENSKMSDDMGFIE